MNCLLQIQSNKLVTIKPFFSIYIQIDFGFCCKISVNSQIV